MVRLFRSREQIVSLDLANETVEEVLQPDYDDGVKLEKLGILEENGEILLDWNT
ncbi:hypothetical protein SLEP1_g52432 [Rubroshorea leprosula]|uniref:Uncharacterized protein n=1 Tax=Rubroshorea leprosula TaxID=152421 RepID=A0AAV5M9Z3_9ROSI|nr:hypothetical protein SLEP1_g52432 [Rubroshorea leprosula]